MGTCAHASQRDGRFRRVNPAASLKPFRLVTADRAPAWERLFPPGKSGGLIEAPIAHRKVIQSTAGAFPPGKSGGLIEARYHASHRRALLSGAFPPGKSGGLIEAHFDARRCKLVQRLRRSSFRRVNPAASLKQGSAETVASRATEELVRFRRVNPAASLKRSMGRCVQGPLSAVFPRVNPAASLKPPAVDNLAASLKFPPGKSGGLIEAERRGNFTSST